MTAPFEEIARDTGSCRYGMQRLPGLLDTFTREIDGVKGSEDIEYIHRMRVASRRLRAALPLFRACFPEKTYERWMQGLSKITRALGDARDADVQIAFLEKSLKKIEKNPVQQMPGAKDTPVTAEPAIRFLLCHLQKKRSMLQKRVLSAVLDLEKSGIPGEMQAAFASLGAGFNERRKKIPLHGIPPVAALRIHKRLSALLSYDPWIHHPEAVAEHHAARIAAKKLRYTMEVYGPLYRNNLEKPLARVKKIQEILGDIHDCDVWIDQVTTLLLRERTLLRTGKGEKRPDTATLSSLKYFLHTRESERRRQYRQFVRYWQALARARLWDELRTTLDTGRKVRYLPPDSYNDADASGAVNAVAGICPTNLPHSIHVTNIALMLFDDLQSLHNLGEHDRFLLKCAGELHDIGWLYGEPGHSRRGAEMVFSDGSLPFDLEERAILALMVLSHRGKIQIPGCPYLTLIPASSRKRALVLASILRIADGFDCRHTGSVGKVRCVLSEGTVICTATGTGDITAEKERALKKADLFRQVCEITLVIP